MSSPLSHDSGTSEVESSESPCDDSSSESSASSESASDPLSVSETSNSAVGTSLVLESSDNSCFGVPADVSLVLALSPGDASRAASVESSDDSSTSPGTAP